jgi:hypothetical protein
MLSTILGNNDIDKISEAKIKNYPFKYRFIFR